MAVSPQIPSEPSKPPSPSPLSKLISKLRSKCRSKPPPPPTQIITLPPLIPTPLPLVLPEHQHLLSHYGWTTITLPPPSPSSSPSSPPPGPHPLQTAYLALFHAAQSFFNSPPSEKEKWSHPLSTEQGYTHIPGEKEFLTLRSLSHTPDLLKQPAARYWSLMGAHLSTTLGRISTSLGLPSGEDEGLRKFVGPCAVMGEGEGDRTASMLRIFRYEAEGEKVVAEAHSDLGLLSAVVGDVAGLEVWGEHGWRDVERGYEGGEITVLGGRQLERLGNGRYPAGGHRVVSYGEGGEGGLGVGGKEGSGGEKADGAENKEAKRYRHSIVFVLRAHEPVLVESDELETEITGRWGERVSGVTAGEMYEEIRGRHFNINIGHEERERQRRNVREGRGKGVERGVEGGKAAG